MKLDRNVDDGPGKYALVKLRRVNELVDEFKGDLREGGVWKEVHEALHTLQRAGVLEYCKPGAEGEFFVIRLRDRFAEAALTAYGAEASTVDPEYAGEIFELAKRSGPRSKFVKMPD